MLRKLLFGAAAAGAVAWLAKNKDTAKAYVDRYGGQLKGAAPGGREPAEERLNDPALARKVESEVFRDDALPKGSISSTRSTESSTSAARFRAGRPWRSSRRGRAAWTACAPWRT